VLAAEDKFEVNVDRPDWKTLLTTSYRDEILRRRETFNVGEHRVDLPTAWWQAICKNMYARIEALEAKLGVRSAGPVDAEIIAPLAQPEDTTDVTSTVTVTPPPAAPVTIRPLEIMKQRAAEAKALAPQRKPGRPRKNA
jgi:hypothetical protein